MAGDRLGDSARTISDGEGSRLSDGVSLVIVSESGGLRAVGGKLRDNLSGVDDLRVGGRLAGLVRASGGSNKGAVTPRVVAHAGSILSSAGSHVGARLDAAGIELGGALGGAVDGRGRRNRMRGLGLGDSARAVRDG
jgi:hypothetical protein